MAQHQPVGDMPQITSSLYGSSSTGWEAMGGGIIAPAAVWAGTSDNPEPEAIRTPIFDQLLRRERAKHEPSTTEPMPNQATARRLVQVFIADPDPNVPLKSALLYRGELTFTDSTDQELYFEVPVATLLAAHNVERAKWLDREASKRAGKDIFLEPARVRDPRMVVVNVASF